MSQSSTAVKRRNDGSPVSAVLDDLSIQPDLAVIQEGKPAVDPNSEKPCETKRFKASPVKKDEEDFSNTIPVRQPCQDGKYLDFYKELNLSTSNVLRLLFLRSFRGEVYVGIRNSAPYSDYKTVVQPSAMGVEKTKGLFLTLPIWARLCSTEIVNWVEDAIMDCLNPEVNDPGLKHVQDAFTTENGEHRAPLGRNNFVTVQLFRNKVYVGLREFYFSTFCQKTIPGRGINLNFAEWGSLVTCMPEVNKFIESLQ